jgi:hypothetical protein
MRGLGWAEIERATGVPKDTVRMRAKKKGLRKNQSLAAEENSGEKGEKQRNSEAKFSEFSDEDEEILKDRIRLKRYLNEQKSIGMDSVLLGGFLLRKMAASAAQGKWEDLSPREISQIADSIAQIQKIAAANEPGDLGSSIITLLKLRIIGPDRAAKIADCLCGNHQRQIDRLAQIFADRT